MSTLKWFLRTFYLATNQILLTKRFRQKFSDGLTDGDLNWAARVDWKFGASLGTRFKLKKNLISSKFHYISTNQPRRQSCPTFGGSQSPWSISVNPRRWLAATESRTRWKLRLISRYIKFARMFKSKVLAHIFNTFIFDTYFQHLGFYSTKF